MKTGFYSFFLSPKLQFFLMPRSSSRLPDLSCDAVRHCQAICRQHAKSFYLASWALPLEKREAAWVVYAFSRVSDDLVDAGGPNAAEKFLQWRAAVQAAFKTCQSDEPVLSALLTVCRAHEISRGLVLRLLDGLQADLKKHRYRTFSELRQYCFRVAAVPGLMMLKVLGCSNARAEKHAADLGIAMQLTNILRDLKEDAARGKVYLPQEDLAAAGYAEADLLRGVDNDHFRRLLGFQIKRARAGYASAGKGIAFLPSDARLCVRLCLAFYSGILDEIGHPAFSPLTRRATVPLTKKLRLAAGLLLRPTLA